MGLLRFFFLHSSLQVFEQVFAFRSASNTALQTTQALGLTDLYFRLSCSSLYSRLQICPQFSCLAARGMYFSPHITQIRGEFHFVSVSVSLLSSAFIPLIKRTAMKRSLICSCDSAHSPDIRRGNAELPCCFVVPAVSAESVASVRVTHSSAILCGSTS